MKTDLDRATALSDRLVAARQHHRRAEHALAVLLTELATEELFRPLGYVSLEDYAGSVLEISARHARELVRIGRALPGLPKLAATFAAGELDWTKARELVRVATEATEEAWLQRARDVPCRILERQVAARSLGQLPPDGDGPHELAPERRGLHLKLESSDYDMVRAAISALRFDLDADADEMEDGDLLARIVQQWTLLRSSETDRMTTGERYRITIELCPDCTSKQLAEVSDTVVAEAVCDAEIVELRPGPTEGHVTRTIPPAIRTKVLGRAKWRCEVPNCRNRLALDIHHVRPRAMGGTHDPAGLVCLCDGHHRAVHRGYLAVKRGADGRVMVRRAGDRTHVGRPGMGSEERRNGGARDTLPLSGRHPGNPRTGVEPRTPGDSNATSPGSRDLARGAAAS